MSNEPIDLEDLQAVAELSKLSWEPNPEGEWFTRDGLLNGHYSFDAMDSDYIEAVPPATVLALVSELKEARATVARVKDLAYNPDTGDMYADSAIVVDATLLQNALAEGHATHVALKAGLR